MSTISVFGDKHKVCFQLIPHHRNSPAPQSGGVGVLLARAEAVS